MVAKAKTALVELNKKQTSTYSQDSPIREAWVATAAYYLAEARGFAPGGEESDWFTAEQAYSAQIRVD